MLQLLLILSLMLRVSGFIHSYSFSDAGCRFSSRIKQHTLLGVTAKKFPNLKSSLLRKKRPENITEFILGKDFNHLKGILIQGDVKTVRLQVRRPDARLRIKAPRGIGIESNLLLHFLLSKLKWISMQQSRILAIPQEPQYAYVNGELHNLWGENIKLLVVEDSKLSVTLQDENIVLRAPLNSTVAKRESVMLKWRKKLLREETARFIQRWEVVVGVDKVSFCIRKMKRCWGTCVPQLKVLKFNPELSKRPISLLEYIVVHELTHLLEASHNARFKALLTSFMPDWKERDDALKQWPLPW